MRQDQRSDAAVVVGQIPLGESGRRVKHLVAVRELRLARRRRGGDLWLLLICSRRGLITCSRGGLTTPTPSSAGLGRWRIGGLLCGPEQYGSQHLCCLAAAFV